MSLYTTPQARAARDWWRELAVGPRGRSNADEERRPASSGALARLRRVRTPLEAMMHTETIDLVLRLVPDGPPVAQERVAGLAAMLAHVREDDPARSIAGRLGGREPDDRLMKPARFRKLMLAEAGEPRLAAFRRAIRMLSPSANVADLATAWLLWDHPDSGGRTRADWMFRYVGANEDDVRGTSRPDDPATNPQTTEETM